MFLVIFGKLLRACFIVQAPARLKIVGVRSIRSNVSVPFANCPSNRGHSEYYSCQTDKMWENLKSVYNNRSQLLEDSLFFRNFNLFVDPLIGVSKEIQLTGQSQLSHVNLLNVSNFSVEVLIISGVGDSSWKRAVGWLQVCSLVASKVLCIQRYLCPDLLVNIHR